MQPSSDIPVYKIGGVILRGAECLVLRPKPKFAGEQAKLVLPRGSRQYRDADGNWQDARDAETAQSHAAVLETISRALSREMFEEAGLPPELLRSNLVEVYALGERLFQSSSKPPYRIYWAVMVVNDMARQKMAAHPDDASEPVQWLALPAIEALAEKGLFSAGYVPVIREALETLGQLPPFAFD